MSINNSLFRYNFPVNSSSKPSSKPINLESILETHIQNPDNLFQALLDYYQNICGHWNFVEEAETVEHIIDQLSNWHERNENQIEQYGFDWTQPFMQEYNCIVHGVSALKYDVGNQKEYGRLEYKYDAWRELENGILEHN